MGSRNVLLFLLYICLPQAAAIGSLDLDGVILGEPTAVMGSRGTAGEFACECQTFTHGSSLTTN
jgi:hypothetical protein